MLAEKGIATPRNDFLEGWLIGLLGTTLDDAVASEFV
jgi:hypothetical protein